MKSGRFHDEASRHDLMVELLSGGASMAETASAVGASMLGLKELCRRIIRIGRGRGIPTSAMENILFPRAFGKEGGDSQRQKYSSNAVSIEVVLGLARWSCAAEAVSAAQDELLDEGLRDLEERMRDGPPVPPPPPLYEPYYNDIWADDYIFVYSSGFRLASKKAYYIGCAWDGMIGFVPEIQGFIDLDEVYHLIDAHSAHQKNRDKPKELSFTITSNKDFIDPGSSTIYHLGSVFGFALPPGHEINFVNFMENVKEKISSRRKRVLINIKHSFEDDCYILYGPVRYEIVK